MKRSRETENGKEVLYVLSGDFNLSMNALFLQSTNGHVTYTHKSKYQSAATTYYQQL